MARPFVHLHVHTDYSLLDGACSLKKLVDKAEQFKMPALTITDHGNLFGAVQFYQKAKEKGIKPIIGCEVYIAPDSRFDKSSREDKGFHLVLLVRNAEGYRNLCRLVSLAYLEGFYYKPRIDMELLGAHTQGLIGLSSCLHGEIASLLGMDEDERAREAARRYEVLFGTGNFYLELQDHGLPEQKKINAKMVELSRTTKIPLVATNDCHYLEADDWLAHEVLVCIQTGKQLADEKRMQFNSQDFYFKSGDEMAALFAQVPEALDNTLAIAERCEFEFDLKSQHYPDFTVPEGFTLASYFETITRRTYAERRQVLAEEEAAGHLKHPLDDYDRRLDYEIDIIKKLNYAGYFLIVWDFIRYAREEGISVGPGRGSAAGSLVAYSLHITDLDPLRYDLLFERFLNPERVSPPDIDIDFCTRRREEVIRYVTEKYGKDSVCQIITFGTMKARAVIRDVGRVLGMSYGEVDRIAKLIPQQLDITIDKALAERDSLLQKAIDEADGENKPKIQRLVDISRKLEGLSRHSSVHAAGVVITPGQLMDIIPLAVGTDGAVVTQYNMKDIEKLGLLKMDFLGLITLTVIDDAVAMISKNRGIDIDIHHVPLDDQKTYELFAEGRTAGVFQFESAGMRGYLRNLKPNCFEDLIAMNALYRPGPIKGGMIEDFIRRKHGASVITYPIPQLEPILKTTYGVLVYQEQVMQAAHLVAGFTIGEADTLRKAMGKKKKDEMAKMESKFVEGGAARGIPPRRVKELYELMAKFAEYGFNKSHSAAYAWVAYQTAYLKAHFPMEFMAALLTSEKNNTSKVVQYIGECKNMGIQILPPSVNASTMDFRPTEAGIRFGLGALKNVGETAIESVLQAREKGGAFKSFTDFCCRVDLRVVNSRVLESMIKAGAFDELGYQRSQLTEILPKSVEFAQKHQKDLAVGQKSLFSLLGAEAETITREEENLPPLPEWDKKRLLSDEKEILGFYTSGHPLDEYADIIKAYTNCTLDQLGESSAGRSYRIGCVLSGIKGKKTQRGDRMAVGQLEDMTGTVDFVVYPKTYTEYEKLFLPDLPVLVIGNCEQEENDNLKIVVNEVHPLLAARDLKVRQVRLELDVERLDAEKAKDLTRLILENPGECAVEVVMHKREVGVATLKTNGFLSIRWSPDMRQRVEALTHPGAVYYVE